MRAVVWNDALQIIILIIGLIVVASLGASKAGGGAAVWEIAKATGRVNYDRYNMDIYSTEIVRLPVCNYFTIFTHSFLCFVVLTRRDIETCILQTYNRSHTVQLMTLFLADNVKANSALQSSLGLKIQTQMYQFRRAFSGCELPFWKSNLLCQLMLVHSRKRGLSLIFPPVKMIS
jgi:hypothetical protein